MSRPPKEESLSSTAHMPSQTKDSRPSSVGLHTLLDCLSMAFPFHHWCCDKRFDKNSLCIYCVGHSWNGWEPSPKIVRKEVRVSLRFLGTKRTASTCRTYYRRVATVRHVTSGPNFLGLQCYTRYGVDSTRMYR